MVRSPWAKLIPLSFFACFAAVSSSNLAANENKVDFQRDVAPILAEHCNHCHGVDMKTREGNLRLDVLESALKGGDSGVAAIIPGKPDASEMIRRIEAHDESELMPPPSQNKPLSPKQKETLKQWVLEGANYETHWAFQPVVKRALPPIETRNPIDAFVVDRLRRENITPNSSADPATLCRRLYLDLVGLPPTPAELVEFEKVGYEATVETLLKSERFGEKWARHWLDLARYSDTNGYEKDLQREQWKYRDWVIAAFNQDMPYDQFIVEQIAGDLMPNASQSQVIATGFLRNSMINEEGAIVPEQFRMVEMFDRMDCLGKAVLGLTTQCSQCHSHKFDPLTHDEYYGMFAFLNNSYEAQSWIYTPEQEELIREIHRKIEAIEAKAREARPTWETDITAWQQQVAAANAGWEFVDFHQLEAISGLNHPTQEIDHSILMKGHTSNDIFYVGRPKLQGVTGIRLEALTHQDFPHSGPGRSHLGTWGVNEFEVFTKAAGSNDWVKQKLVNATADFSEAEQKQGDGKKAKGPVSHLIDGTDDTTWNADRGVGLRNQSSVAVMQFEKPLELPEGTEVKVVMRMTDMLGCCRISLTTTPAPVALPVDYDAQRAIVKPDNERTEVERSKIFAAWRASVPELKSFTDEISALWKSYPQAPTSILHLAEREPTNPRPTFLLDRGNWDQPKQEIKPHIPAAFHPLPENAPSNRLGFAMWLADSRSPLTSRVAVNRVWQSIFGLGLVETADDFGTRAPVPEYREMLDWLAADFVESGWSQKNLIRLIVTSDTYKRSSKATPELLERDPRNVLLARGPRFRADAEVVRDIALAVSGLITHKVGGPGVIPPVPQNVLDYNYTYPGYWKPAEGPERYRRSVYGFRKRSMPDPVMSSFDAPNGDLSCARRVRSNTPLAALTGLNEPIFVEAARAFGLRVVREGGVTDEDRIRYAYVLCTSRQPNAREIAEVQNLLNTRRQKLADGWLNSREIISGDPANLPQLPEGTTPTDTAAWVLVGRVMLNLDETISKN